MARKTIRLACMACDRSDFDGITAKQLREAIQNGWRDVEQVQGYAEACEMYVNKVPAPEGYSAFDWWTHIGWCPECAQELD